MSDLIRIERDGFITTVELHRPDKLNALTKSMWQHLGNSIEQLSTEDIQVRCIVVRGAGNKSFSPGNDIGEFEDERSNVDQARAYGAIMNRTLAAFRNCPVPIVAMIKGVCVGGGLEIAAVCDIRVCGESSRFGIPINRLGLVMAPTELEALIDIVGRATALEILLEGQIFDAKEALAKGLVHRIVPDNDVEDAAYITARRIAEGAPLVARWHKKFVARLADPTPLSTEEIEEGYACYDTEDFRIGYQAFLKKTKPEFIGR
ncbi:MAG: enoyl-CoA hydratase-related protein [Arenicellales bacterium]|nr:enoyl-CoA hydratase-related protein [Arenicellales bacterium]